jgi:N-acetylmuramoyl-L-alanine amidase
MREELELGLGEIDPVEDISGVQARLNNLGFHCGEEDGEHDALLEQAIADFQARHDLEPTGELDDATRATLLEEHGG